MQNELKEFIESLKKEYKLYYNFSKTEPDIVNQNYYRGQSKAYYSIISRLEKLIESEK